MSKKGNGGETISTGTSAVTQLVGVRFHPGMGKEGKWVRSDQVRSIPMGLCIPAQGFRTLGQRVPPGIINPVRVAY